MLARPTNTLLPELKWHRVLGLLERSGHLSDRLARVPCVPSTDWCDRVADALTSLQPEGDAIILLADLTPEGRVKDLHSAGTASWTPAGPRRERALALRCAADGLIGQHWHPASTPPAGLPAKVEAQALFAERIAPLHRAIWNVPVTSTLTAAGARLTPPHRALLIYLTGEQPAEEREEACMLVQVFAERAARLAGQALGTEEGPILWLTHREKEVLDRLVLGNSVKEISDELGRSPHTVHDHVKSLHRKLRATSRGELIAKALGHLPNTPAPVAAAAQAATKPFNGPDHAPGHVPPDAAHG